MIDISVNELVKSFEVGQTLLDGLSFDIHEGECVGIMGRNGCGKTTLFRLLTGELSPDSGEIHIAAGKKLGLISQIPVYPAGFSCGVITSPPRMTRFSECAYSSTSGISQTCHASSPQYVSRAFCSNCGG